MMIWKKVVTMVKVVMTKVFYKNDPGTKEYLNQTMLLGHFSLVNRGMWKIKRKRFAIGEWIL